MNCETCQLKELELEPAEIRDVLQLNLKDGILMNLWRFPKFPLLGQKPVGYAGILHTIFFHRTLSLVRPKDVDCEFFEITYVQCGVPELEKEVDEKIDQFIAWAEKHPNRRSQVCLSFFDEKNKHPGWFGNKTERIYWEQWFINLHVRNSKRYSKSSSSKGLTSIEVNAPEETSSRRSTLKSVIHEVLFQIINFANEKKDHIPAIPDRIFNHEILIPSSTDSVFGWNTDVLRRVLNSGHPYSL